MKRNDQHPQQPTPAAWPEATIARYLTDAGKALADPSITVDLSQNPTTRDITGVCHGCKTTVDDSNYIGRSLSICQHWAQEHAEKCRALPRPAVTA